MRLKRNISFLGTNKRLLFHCQSQARLLFRVMQTSKFCLEEILKENLRKARSNSCYLIHKGETLLASAQHTLGCSWPIILGRREESLVGKRQVGPHAGLPVSPDTAPASISRIHIHCEVSWLFCISVAVISCIFYLLFHLSLLIGILSCV